MERGVKTQARPRRTTKAVLVGILIVLLAVSMANAAVVIFSKTVQVIVGEPITFSNPNWLPASQSISPGQNTNYTVTISNSGPNTYQTAIILTVVSDGPNGTARLYLNSSLILTVFFDGNSTTKTHTFSFAPGTFYDGRLNLAIPATSPAGHVNMTVTVQRLG